MQKLRLRNMNDYGWVPSTVMGVAMFVLLVVGWYSFVTTTTMRDRIQAHRDYLIQTRCARYELEGEEKPYTLHCWNDKGEKLF